MSSPVECDPTTPTFVPPLSRPHRRRTKPEPAPADRGAYLQRRRRSQADACLGSAAMTRNAESDSGADAWETHADWWVSQVSTGLRPEYADQIIPLAIDLLAGRRQVVDIGAGDGQIARALSEHDHDVVAVEPTRSLAAIAQLAPKVCTVRASANDLPVSDGTLDGAVASLVFEHITDFHGALDEIVRVLKPGGRFVWFLNHPLTQAPGSGWVEDYISDEHGWRIGTYGVASLEWETLDNGVELPFFHRPLAQYINGLIDAGLELETMLEPAPPESYFEAGGNPIHRVIPRLMVLVARSRAQ